MSSLGYTSLEVGVFVYSWASISHSLEHDVAHLQGCDCYLLIDWWRPSTNSAIHMQTYSALSGSPGARQSSAHSFSLCSLSITSRSQVFEAWILSLTPKSLHFHSRVSECTSLLCTCSVAQLCPTPCNPIDCSLLGSSVPGILQARILECVVISPSSSRPRDRSRVSCVSCVAGGFFHCWATGKPLSSSLWHFIIRALNSNNSFVMPCAKESNAILGGCMCFKEGIPNLLNCMPNDQKWSWCNYNRNKMHNKCHALELSWNHPSTTLVHGKIVFHKTVSWCQKCWGLLS